MISERLAKVVLSELKLENFVLTNDTIAVQVPGWDSLNHVRILAAVEKEFGIRIKGLEAIRLKNVGDLQALVDKKLNLKDSSV